MTQLGARDVADRDEHAGRGVLAGLAGDGVAQGHAGDLGVAVDGDDLAVPGELDLRVVRGAVGHDLRGAQLVAAVHHRDALAEAGEERGLLDGGVAAADHDDLLVAEEEPVAGGAPGDAAAGQALLVVQAELAVRGAGGQDDGARAGTSRR